MRLSSISINAALLQYSRPLSLARPYARNRCYVNVSMFFMVYNVFNSRKRETFTIVRF